MEGEKQAPASEKCGLCSEHSSQRVSWRAVNRNQDQSINNNAIFDNFFYSEENGC